MINVQDLNGQLHAGRNEVTSSPKGILSLARRLSIWRAMIDDDNPEWSYQTRVHLNSLCVHRVQHVWHQVFPENSGKQASFFKTSYSRLNLTPLQNRPHLLPTLQQAP